MIRPTTARAPAPLATKEEIDALRRENEALRRALEACKVVGGAKAILMTEDGFSESGAHRYIQKSSMDTGVPMAEVARAFIRGTHARRRPVTTAQFRRTRGPWRRRDRIPFWCVRKLAGSRITAGGWGGRTTPASDRSAPDLCPVAARRIAPARPHDRMGGFGSAIAYTGIGQRYVDPDRGPADGTTSYRGRYYLIDVVVTPDSSPPVTVSLVQATPLSREDGQTFTGCCPDASLTTALVIEDGGPALAAVATQEPWVCFGTGNQYLKSPP